MNSNFTFTETQVRSFFSALYDPGQKLKRRTLIELMVERLDGSTKALEVGAGPGDMLASLVEAGLPHSNYIYFDYSERMHRFAGQLNQHLGFSTPLQQVRGDALYLPFKDAPV